MHDCPDQRYADPGNHVNNTVNMGHDDRAG